MTVPAPAPIPEAAALFGLDPKMRHLNHGSVGAVPHPVRSARRDINDDMERDPRGFFKRRVETTTAARQTCAEFVGADVAHSAFVKNVTAGVALALHAMKLSAGDEVVTTDHGYGAIDFNVATQVREVDAVHRIAKVPLNPTDEEMIAAVMAEVGERTALVICDHVTSSTARLFPIAKLAAKLRDRGVALLVDAAHVPGHLPADIAGIQADFWVGNLHKWAFAPRGTALLSVAPHWVGRMRPFVESWQYQQGYPVSVEYNGTDDFTGWLAAPAGIEVLRDLGVERVRRHNAELVRYGQHVLAERLAVSIDDPGPSPLAMRVVRLPEGIGTTQQACGDIEAAIRTTLRTELTVNSFNGVGIIRIAAQVYNTADDYDGLAARLPELLPAVGRD